MSEYELHTQGARHSFEPHYDGNDPDRNKPYTLDHDAVAEQMCLSAGLTEEQANNLLSRLNGPLYEARRQIAALTEDYKDLESQLAAVGAGGVSAQRIMGKPLAKNPDVHDNNSVLVGFAAASQS